MMERDLSWNVKNGLLFKKVNLRQYPNCESAWKLFVPNELRGKVIKECHDEVKAGHLGVRKTAFRVKQFYYWPNVIQDVKQYIKSCETCARFKTKPFIESQLVRNKVFGMVKDKMERCHMKSSNVYNKKRNVGSLQVGDIVWKRTKYLSNANKKFMAKLAPKFEKAVVTEKLSETVFRLNNIFGKPIGMWHIKDLKTL
ncbi:hypothetical protein HW555_001190 [Spodoptera exigua]|uniref:RNA-directed DNA polymerase n=2 Tax=Spodoptera exigua TaxID=7107 RepID=A0A835GQZ5_SPOEX|nr:hypothetical protein HW555_001190 [Spodoptera exigua]